MKSRKRLFMNLFEGEEQRCRLKRLVDTVGKGEGAMN